MVHAGERNVPEEPPAPGLHRRLSLPLITFYGIGTIVGGGIYALLGKVAGEAGMAAPLAFLIAAGVAALEMGAFRGTVLSAVFAAWQRCRELST